MAGKPLIASPDLARRARRLAAVNIEGVVRTTAVDAARTLLQPLRTAAKAAGASPRLVQNIRVQNHHTSVTVMRHPANHDDVIVGVPGESRYAPEADELEFGGPDTPPTGWVRTTVMQHAPRVRAAWSAGMTAELDRRSL